MSEDTQTVTESKPTKPAPPAEAKNTEPSQANGAQPVPYERFTEVNQRMRELERQLAERDQADKAAEEAKLKEQGKLQELLDAKSAELQAAQSQVATLVKAQRSNSISAAIETAARDAGFANPADAAAFLDVDAVELNEDGRPVGIAESVKQLAIDRPYLLATVEARPGNQTGPRPVAPANKQDKQIRRDASAYVRARF